jgi:hypothetical protein
MYVHRKNMKNKQKEWHRATKPFKKYGKLFFQLHKLTL